MRACLILLTAALVCPGQQLYEEDLLKQMPLRIQQWKELEAYVGKLPASGAFAAKIGYPPPRLSNDPQLRIEKTGEDAIGIYHRVYIRISPELETYGLFIVPKNLKGPAPLVISMHGGGGFPEMATFHGGTNYHDMVRGAVERGYVTFAPLHIFYYFRDRDKGTPIPQQVREQLDEPLKKHGTSLMAVEIAKITKALDVLLKRPEVDPKRVAMIGLSWGGYYTLYTTALEPRIKVAVASGAFQAEAKPEYGRPHDISTQDLVALIAPRPIQVQIGDKDKGISSEKARESLKGSPCELQIFDGVHEWRGDIAWEFLKKHL